MYKRLVNTKSARTFKIKICSKIKWKLDERYEISYKIPIQPIKIVENCEI